jgi:hypothetical protein
MEVMAVEPSALWVFMIPNPGLYQDIDSVLIGGMECPAIFTVTVLVELILKQGHVPAEVITDSLGV